MMQVLLRMLAAYYNHVRAFENTLVIRFYGLHCVKLTGTIQKKVRSENNATLGAAWILIEFISFCRYGLSLWGIYFVQSTLSTDALILKDLRLAVQPISLNQKSTQTQS